VKLLDNIRGHVLSAPWSWGFFFITLLLHILWPLTEGSLQATLTTLAVLTLAISSFSAALYNLGVKQAILMLLIVTALAFTIEKIGSTTGVPFGEYSYSEKLNPQLIGVPIAVVFAWFAMTWVMCVFVHDIKSSLIPKSIIAGLLLTGWDFYLDPQMTSKQYWIWHTTSPSLPGIPGIPLTNYLGWFLSGIFLAFIVLAILQKVSVDRTLAKLVLLWTIVGGFILHAIFWRDLYVGLWGLLTMGALWISVERLRRFS
jgi:uncharacterized membrane protein